MTTDDPDDPLSPATAPSYRWQAGQSLQVAEDTSNRVTRNRAVAALALSKSGRRRPDTDRRVSLHSLIHSV